MTINAATPLEGSPDNHQDDKHSADSTSIAHLYTQYASNLTISLRRLFGDGPPDPDDITQMAFQKLLERDGAEDIRDPRAFLWRTAKNLVLTEKRRDVIRTKYEPDIEAKFFGGGGAILDPQRVLLAEDQLRLVNEVLHLMPEKRRRAFMLHRIEGLRVSDVAR
ncbi:MAG: sigma-70 family RNA polymerase sigma factor, partial [Pseudomonadota bacterium]